MKRKERKERIKKRQICEILVTVISDSITANNKLPSVTYTPHHKRCTFAKASTLRQGRPEMKIPAGMGTIAKT